MGLVFVQGVIAQGPSAIPDPEPPSPSVATPSPPIEPSPDDEYPFYGCGGTGQKCCVAFIAPFEGHKCLFKDDVMIFTDNQGRTVDYPVYDGMKVSGGCTCQPKSGYSTNAIDVCKEYFTPSKRAEIVNPGLWPNGVKPLNPSEVEKLNMDLSACSACAANGGMYTALGCIPYRFDSFIQAIIYIAITLGGIYALFCIIVAAMKIQTSKGDASVIGKSRENVTSCLIGLVLIIFSVFITNIFASGLLGFKIDEPLKSIDSKSTDEIMCSRGCIYSEKSEGKTRCYQGACPSTNPECGKPGTGGVVPINNDCLFAPQCGNFKEVSCP